MTYYKVIQNNKFIGIGTSYELRKYQLKHNILLVADDDTAQYIDINGILYRDSWLKVLTTDTIQYENADIVVISEEEYQQLFEAIDKGEEITIIESNNDYTEEIETVDPIIAITVDYLKSEKIKETSYMCNQIITNGFDIVLSDNIAYHFSLTIQDQLNLITLSTMISNGETEIPYHADGQLCKIFSAEDMTNIIQMATTFKTYHTTYFNALKNYVNSLDDIHQIAEIQYGIELPEEYQSEVLKALNV